jgi:hypothetical protein
MLILRGGSAHSAYDPAHTLAGSLALLGKCRVRKRGQVRSLPPGSQSLNGNVGRVSEIGVARGIKHDDAQRLV